jgi:hypothetical protein
MCQGGEVSSSALKTFRHCEEGVLPGEVIPKFSGDCFAAKYAARNDGIFSFLFILPHSFFPCKYLFDLRLQHVEELGQAIPFIERDKGTQIQNKILF